MRGRAGSGGGPAGAQEPSCRGRLRPAARRRWRDLLAVAAVVAMPWPAAATQEYILPTLFDVTGVAADDVLNVRAAPRVGAPVIGTLAPDARGIEVVAHDPTGLWGRVNLGEQSGWARLHYLMYRVDVWAPGALPADLQCRGTEPFWGLRAEGDTLIFSTPDEPATPLRIGAIRDTGVFRDPRRSVTAEGEALRLTAVVVPMACSDGMSDRAYGLDATLLLEAGGAVTMLTGCCTIAPR